MTIRQEAYRLIDDLTDDNVRLMVLLMTKITGNQGYSSVSAPSDHERSETDRIRAFEELQRLRKTAEAYQFSDFESEREAAMREKGL